MMDTSLIDKMAEEIKIEIEKAAKAKGKPRLTWPSWIYSNPNPPLEVVGFVREDFRIIAVPWYGNDMLDLEACKKLFWSKYAKGERWTTDSEDGLIDQLTDDADSRLFDCFEDLCEDVNKALADKKELKPIPIYIYRGKGAWTEHRTTDRNKWSTTGLIQPLCEVSAK